MSASEKRKHPRLPVNLPATYRSTGLVQDVRVSNLSKTGLSIACEETEPLGTEAEVLLSLPAEQEPIPLQGVVIWVSSNPDHPGMGIQFRDLPAEARSALTNYLMRSSYSQVPLRDE